MEKFIDRFMNGIDRHSRVVAFAAILVATAWIIIPAILTIFLR